MEINLGLILASLINFFILFAILKHFFFNKVEAIIEEREEYINKQMDDAEEATNKARLLAIENERILKQAREEGKKITEEKKKKQTGIDGYISVNGTITHFCSEEELNAAISASKPA